MIIDFDWLSQPGVQNVLNMVYKIVDVVRIIVPIILILMTTLDISKKIIDPNDKEGQKKILIRTIAAVIVFFIPTIINLIFNIADIDIDNIKMKKSSTPTTKPVVTTKPSVTPTSTTKPTSSPVEPTSSPLEPTASPKPKRILKAPCCINGKDTYYTDMECERADAAGVDGTEGECPGSKIENLEITNCPNSTVFHPNQSVTLNTNIPSTYTGSIEWSVDYKGEKYLKFNDKTKSSAVINVLDIGYDTNTVVTVKAGNKTATCNINIGREKLDSVNITNCPENDNKYVKYGGKIELKTSIPESFGGEIEWEATEIGKDVSDSVKITKNKTGATVEIVGYPTSAGTVWITVIAGGKASTCHITVSAVDELKYTNCPNSNKKYHVGDSLTLNTNLPTSYRGNTSWASSIDSSIAKVTPIGNGISAKVEIVGVPEDGYIYIPVAADSPIKVVGCRIYVEK